MSPGGFVVLLAVVRDVKHSIVWKTLLGGFQQRIIYLWRDGPGDDFAASGHRYP